MAIDIRPLAVGPLEANCYILWDSDTLSAAVVDPGGDRELIANTVASLNLKVEYILLTHAHLDHSFCVGDLAKEWGAKVAMHESDIPLLIDDIGLGEMFYDMSSHVEFSPSILLSEGDELHLGESVISVIHTPGHSPGGLCFKTDAGIICGDTIFAGGIGRTDFPGGSYDQLMESIKTKILTLDDSIRLYPGHGPSTTVGRERATNPFL